MRQFTFEQIPAIKSYQCWVTLRFEDSGDVTMLSRDPVRSTRPVWVVVGSLAYDSPITGEPAYVVNFLPGHDKHPLRIAATNLDSRGYEVYGVSILDTETRVYSPETLHYPARLTVPRSILSFLAGTAPDRTRSLDLGLHAKGREHATMDISTMANKAASGDAAIMARQALAARVRKV